MGSTRFGRIAMMEGKAGKVGLYERHFLLMVWTLWWATEIPGQGLLRLSLKFNYVFIVQIILKKIKHFPNLQQLYFSHDI